MAVTLPVGAAAGTEILLPGEQHRRTLSRIRRIGMGNMWTMTDARSPIRALRAALFAAVCVTVAAMGHSSVSAHGIPLSALLAAFGVTAAADWLAAGRRRGVPTIGTGLLAVQGALHLIFSGGRPALAFLAIDVTLGAVARVRARTRASQV
jgi:hypothetical protein